MTKDEALKMALEALDGLSEPYYVLKAQAAIKEALSQPEQEPVAWMYPDDYERMTTSETFCTVYSVMVGSATRGESTVALYTNPPQRTWVGLTDEEKILMSGYDLQYAALIGVVERALKEKNT